MAGEADAISLHTLHALGEDEEVIVAEERQGQLEAVDILKPQAYDLDYVTVPSVPVLSKSQSNFWWALAQIRRPLAIVLVTCICIICHFTLTQPAGLDEALGLRSWVPIFLATGLAAFTSHYGHSVTLLYSYERRRGLYLSVWIVTCVVAPYLSLPVSSVNEIPYKAARFGRWWGDWGSSNEPSIHSILLAMSEGIEEFCTSFEMATGRSMKVAAPFYPVAQISFPSWSHIFETSKYKPPATWGDYIQPRTPFTILTFDHTSFDLLRDGRGPNEVASGDTPVQFVATLPAMITTNQPLGDTMIITREVKLSEHVGLAFECEYLSTSLYGSVIQTPSGIDVPLVDSDGCSGTVQLLRKADPPHIDNVTALLHHIQANATEILENQDARVRVLSYVDAYLQRLNESISLEQFDPALMAAESTSEACRRKFFVATTTRAVIPSQASLDMREIEAARCMPRFTTYTGGTIFGQYFGNKLQRELDRTFDDLKVDFDDVSLTRKARQNSETDPRVAAKFDDFLLDHIRTLASEERSTSDLTGHLQDELSDIYWNRPASVGPLLSKLKYIRSSFTNVAFEAAELTLIESADKTITEFPRPGHFYPYYTNLKDSAAFAASLLFWAGPSLGHLYIFLAYHAAIVIVGAIWLPQLFATIKAYGQMHRLSMLELPDNRLSIATKAALLCDSRIRVMLRRVKHISDLGGLASALYIANWDVDENFGRSGLRIDYLHSLAGDLKGQRPQAQDGNQKEKHPMKDDKDWAQHAQPLPLCLGPRSHIAPAVMILLYAVLLVVQTSCRWPRLIIPWKTNPVIQQVLARGNNIVALSWWRVAYLYFLPTCLAFYISFLWWRQLYVFYCNRQPWVSLKIPQRSHLGLTLNYSDSLGTIYRSICNRHWAVAFLGFCTIVHIGIPALQTCLYTPTWHTASDGNFTGRTTFEWRDTIDPTLLQITELFDEPLADTLNGLRTWRQMPQWSTRQRAFLPVTFDEPAEQTGLWSMPTSFVAGELDCEEATVRLAIDERSGNTDRIRVSAAHIEHLGFSIDQVLDNPCFHDDQTDEHESNVEHNIAHAACGRWFLVNSTAQTDTPAYISVIWLHGNASHSATDYGMYYTSRPSAIGVVCKASVTRGSGSLLLSSEDFSLANATLFEYNAAHEETMDASVGGVVTRGMLEAATAPKSVSLAGNFANTPNFVGDILSYASYRHFYLHLSPPMNTTMLGRGASAVFSTYFSALAQRSPLFKEGSNSTIEVQPLKIEYRLDVNRPVQAVLLCFVVLWLGTLLTLGRVPSTYRLPFAPESLAVSLFVLAQGGLVEMIEKRIPDAAEMHPDDLRREVETWEDKFMLDVVEVAGHSKHTIVATETLTARVEHGLGTYRDDEREDEPLLRPDSPRSGSANDRALVSSEDSRFGEV